MKLFKKYVLTILLCFGVFVQAAYAAAAVSGSKIYYAYNSVYFDFHHITEVEGDNGLYIPDLDMNNLRDEAIAMAKYVKDMGIKPQRSILIKNGVASVSGLASGWYLVTGDTCKDGNQVITPVPVIINLGNNMDIHIKHDISTPGTGIDPSDKFPIDPSKPTTPMIPLDPIGPTTPATPIDPSIPTDPAIPMDPSIPTEPVDPSSPNEIPETPEGHDGEPDDSSHKIPQTGLDWITPAAIGIFGASFLFGGFYLYRKKK